MESVSTAANAFFGAKGWHKSQLSVRPGGCCRTIDVFIYCLFFSVLTLLYNNKEAVSSSLCQPSVRRRGTWECAFQRLGNQNISKPRFQEYVHLLGCWPGLHKPTHTHTQRPSVSVRLRVIGFCILVCVCCQNVPRVNLIAAPLHAVRATNINSLCAKGASITAEGCLVRSVTPTLSRLSEFRLPQWPQLFEQPKLDMKLRNV